MKKIAVVLFNLGGPDRPEAVRPFLFNLFNDPAILRMPAVPRWLLAQCLASRRAPVARAIYAQIGGASPIVANTEAQAKALRAALREDQGVAGEVETFIAMRYWHPESDAAALAVKAFAPDRIVLLPLYPQFSTTTTASSVVAWRRAGAKVGLSAPATAICCYPGEPGWVTETTRHLRTALAVAAKSGTPRVLFSAHGLPKSVIDGGDPYQWQIERSAAAMAREFPGLDWKICYQSRVGPQEWLGPATDVEIVRAGWEGVPVVVVAISFVSDHSETLVELDIKYARLARESGVPAYVRVPVAADGEDFIAGLARLVKAALAAGGEVCAGAGGRICPGAWSGCPLGGDRSGGGTVAGE